MFYCWMLITFKGRFVSPKHFIQSYIGFFILTMIIVIISALARYVVANTPRIRDTIC